MTILKTTDGKTWQLQHESGDSINFNKVAAIDDRTAMVFSNDHYSFKSEDGGSTWDLVEVPWLGAPDDVQLDGDHDLWVLKLIRENSVLYKTTNFGKSWSSLEIPQPYTASGMYVQDKNTIWLLGTDNEKEESVVLVSRDGGTSWKQYNRDASPALGVRDNSRPAKMTERKLSKIVVQDNSHVWTGGVRTLKEGYAPSVVFSWTTDAGASWRKSALEYGGTINGMEAVGEEAVMLADETEVYRTGDGGNTWKRVYRASINDKVTDIEVVNEKTAFISTKLNGIQKSENGGFAWEPQFASITQSYPYVESDLHNMTAADDTTAWVCGGDTVFGTHDGGTSWQRQLTVKDVEHWSLSAVDKENAFAVAFTKDGFFPDSTLYKTVDGGLTWTPQPLFESSDFIDISAVDSRTIWAIEDSGKIIKTQDGGATWITRKAGLGEGSSASCSIYPVSSDVVWARVDTIIYKTSDGGQTWIQVNDIELPKNQGSITVYEVDDKTAWVLMSNVEANILLTKTTDGGQTWNEVEYMGNVTGKTSCHSPMYICGTGENNIMLFSSLNAAILETIDSGATWYARDMGVDGYVIWTGAVSPNYIWLAGENGTILKGPRTLK